MVISSVLEGSYCGSLTRINQLFISVIIPTLPQEEPRGHAGWAHATGMPHFVASGGEGRRSGEGRHHQAALTPSPQAIVAFTRHREDPAWQASGCRSHQAGGTGAGLQELTQLRARGPGEMANLQGTQGARNSKWGITRGAPRPPCCH